MASDFKEGFDLKQIDFPTCVTQPMLVDISDISMQYQELSERQNDESVKTLLNIKGVMAMRQKLNIHIQPLEEWLQENCSYSSHLHI
ncbi:hypothetical protein TNCV_4223771 [Trichonephila clavipes]|nr:hypothetical protein TNCV_4223771 [Trichonephila clavipes]